MHITESNLNWKGSFTKRPYNRRIVIHHSASGASTTIQDIHSWHLAKGWTGCGYHYVIYPDGSIHRGRPEWTIGAHAYQDSRHEANSDGIGICLIGNFTAAPPTKVQLQALVELVKDIWNRYPDTLVMGHKDVQATSCPGDSFPWAGFQELLKGDAKMEDWKLIVTDKAQKEGLISGSHNPEAVPDKAFVLAVALNLLAKIQGGK